MDNMDKNPVLLYKLGEKSAKNKAKKAVLKIFQYTCIKN
jgi:hypothetical protein